MSELEFKYLTPKFPVVNFNNKLWIAFFRDILTKEKNISCELAKVV